MKITYHENPLRTTVELDENDRQVFWLKIKVEELKNRLFDVHFSLTEGEFFDIERARRSSDPESYIQEDNQEKVSIDKRVDMLFDTYVKELSGWHSGDCTCVACSCMKCHAEEILGVDTLKPFPGKQVLAKIDSAFLSYENGEKKSRSLDQALKYLKDHKISRKKPDNWMTTQEEYERHIPRWENEQARAYEYLSNYEKEHFLVRL
jgi:hypothetical protein